MQYMGGKARIARRVVEAILADTPNRERWFEPFVGGGNVLEHAAPHFGRSVGADAHPDLILMWSAAATGWIPGEVTRERYRELRTQDPSAERGFAGFGASFGGKWFGGYGSAPIDARHPYGVVWPGSVSSVVRQGAVFGKYDVRFRCMRFGEYTPPPGTVVYCDPPYAGTTGYSTGSFDYGHFYAELGRWAATGCPVYVSEYKTPDDVDATVIWSREKRNVLKKDDNQRVSVENLFRINPAN